MVPLRLLECRDDPLQRLVPGCRAQRRAALVANQRAGQTFRMREKFGRRFRTQEPLPDFSSVFEVESYLRYRGSQFVQRFDANSYLTITRAMDYLDIAEEHGGNLANAFKGTRSRFCLISFDSDWLYPTA